MAIKFLDLKKQYLGIKGEIETAISSVVESGAFVGGSEISAFEEEFSEFLGGGVQTLSVANGTDALEIAIESLALPKDSVVLVPANTFAASAEAVVRNGLKLQFVDCGADYTMDLADLRAKITPQTSAILIVHLYGQSARIEEILEIAKEKNLRVIEDCAQAHGAKFKGRCVGAFGDIAAFSFYPGKNLGAYGDGGAIVSCDSALLQRCEEIAHHGGLKKYEHRIVGRNSRLDNLQAAILRVKLRHLADWNARRREVAKLYFEGFKDCKVIRLPQVKESCECVWHLFVILVKNREAVMTHLKQKGIEYGLHYPIALPNCPAFNHQPYVVESPTPNASAWQEEILSLPMGEHLSDEEVKEVIKAVKDAVCG